MRSFGFTILLLIVAGLVCALTGWQWHTGNFNAIFGAPATPVGEPLYRDFQPEDVKRIQIRTQNAHGVFFLEPDGWMAEQPWTDRMDARLTTGIIGFTLGMKVVDHAPLEKSGTPGKSIKEHGVFIDLADASGQPLARYSLGSVAPWKAEEKDNPDPVPTVFVRTMDQDRKDTLYVVTGDITSIFKDNLRFFRDHHPFYFNPLALQKISLSSAEGDITLGRATPQSPWRIVKPLDLPTESAAVRNLIEGLYELQALKVADRAEVTLPATTRATRISLQSFGSDEETVLEIHPPDSPTGTDALATVSNRPNTIFTLPLKPERGLVSLADLPLALNSLRDPALTRLNIAALRGIQISSLTGENILITRQQPAPWQATVGDATFLANEGNLYRLLKAVTTSRALAFESDAATDFTPWGLDQPFLTLRFLATDNQTIEIRFGMDGKGGVFANRLGTPSVIRVNNLLIRSISTRPYEWLHERPWNLNRVFLTSIVREQAGQSPLILRYNFNFESWSGQTDGRDITADIDSVAANLLLQNLETLKTVQWLAADHATARQALLSPELKFTVTEREVDDMSETTGVITRTLALAPDPKNPSVYYGAVSSSPHPFLIDATTVTKLTAAVTD
ncbi:MAG: DUF4340 domain-containing protein [Verrucomicrobiota bacterium]